VLRDCAQVVSYQVSLIEVIPSHISHVTLLSHTCTHTHTQIVLPNI